MAIKYWEFEDAPLKEKLKEPNVKTIANIFFENETESYRFALLLLEAKKKDGIKLKDVPSIIPIATAKRYLDFGVQVGILKHENNIYSLTDRFTKPLRNIAVYIKEWMDSKTDEDITLEFSGARTSKQEKRGGRKISAETIQNNNDKSNENDQ